MPKRIREGLLGDSIEGHLHRGRQASDAIETGGIETHPFDAQAGGFHPVAQIGQVRERRCGCHRHGPGAARVVRVAGLIGMPQGRDEPLHLEDRRPTRCLDRAQCGDGLRGRTVDRPPGRRGLDPDDADVVGHHVVQLARDRQPLLEQGAGLAIDPVTPPAKRPQDRDADPEPEADGGQERVGSRPALGDGPDGHDDRERCRDGDVGSVRVPCGPASATSGRHGSQA